MSRFPRIGNLEVDFSAITVNVSGTPIYGVTSIDFDHGLEPGTKRVAGHPGIAARGRGTYNTSGKMTMLLRDGQELLDELGDGFCEVEFLITVQARPKGGDMITWELRQVRIKKGSFSGKEGQDVLERTFELDIIEILDGGLRAYSLPEES